MHSLFRTKTFIKSFRKQKISDKHFEKFVTFVSTLLKGDSLPPEARDHPLEGSLNDLREFHVSGDLLVLYYFEDGYLKLVDIGTHSELFE